MSMAMALHHYSNFKQPCAQARMKKYFFKLVDKMLPAILSQNSSDALPHFIDDTSLLRRLDKVSGKIKTTSIKDYQK